MRRRSLSTAGAYLVSAVAHVLLFAWAWSLPTRSKSPLDQVEVQLTESVKPKPVEPKPDPEPQEPAEPARSRPTPQVVPPPPDTPDPRPTEPAPAPSPPPSAPVRLGLSMSSTSIGGGFAATVGEPPGPAARDIADTAASNTGDPIADATEVTSLPEAIDIEIPKDEYPKEALNVGFEGEVVLRLVIDETGRVKRARALKDPGYGLGQGAIRVATKFFRFKPATRGGSPVATEISFTVHFELP